MARRTALALTLTLVAAVLGCSPRPEVVARIGDDSVEVGAVQAYLTAAAGESWEAIDDRVATRLLDQFLDQEVLAIAADACSEAGLSADPRARSRAVRALIPRICGPAPAAPRTAVAAEVGRRLAEHLPTRAHVRQLLLDDREDALAARRRLEAGDDFLTLSREISLAPNAASGGELGLIVEGTLPEDLDRVIFALGGGEISQPVESPAGFHIFQVLERVPAGPPERGEIERAVEQELGERAAREHVAACVERLGGEIGVRVYADRLWFAYGGRYAEDDNAVQE